MLHNLRPAPSGTYIDVGAFHPWRLSNTYKLYLRGWSGVTVEPNATVAKAFRRLRPRDVHLANGISPERSRRTYYEFENAVYNSFDKAHAESLGVRPIGKTEIECITLQDVVDSHLRGGAIDLLSVDCEGFDLSVLQSLDWKRNRPNVVIVEDFDQFKNNLTGQGNSQIQSYLMSRQYVYFSQCMYSFIYVDSLAFALKGDKNSGFSCNSSQLADYIF